MSRIIFKRIAKIFKFSIPPQKYSLVQVDEYCHNEKNVNTEFRANYS